MEVRDLDTLRPEKRVVKLGGKEIDVSFIPTGLTFDIDAITKEMAAVDRKKVTKGDQDEIHKAFDLGVKLCATFCQWKHEEMTEQWFHENTTAPQVQALGEEIQDALARAYEGAEYSKNPDAAQVTVEVTP